MVIRLVAVLAGWPVFLITWLAHDRVSWHNTGRRRSANGPAFLSDSLGFGPGLQMLQLRFWSYVYCISCSPAWDELAGHPINIWRVKPLPCFVMKRGPACPPRIAKYASIADSPVGCSYVELYFFRKGSVFDCFMVTWSMRGVSFLSTTMSRRERWSVGS